MIRRTAVNRHESDTEHQVWSSALTGQTSGLRGFNSDSCERRPGEARHRVSLCRRTPPPLPTSLCRGSGRFRGCIVRPSRSVQWSESPQWPPIRPASGSPAPPVVSKSWSDRGAPLSFQRSEEQRETAETMTASLWDRLQDTNTKHIIKHIQTCIFNHYYHTLIFFLMIIKPHL